MLYKKGFLKGIAFTNKINRRLGRMLANPCQGAYN
jgi:hypothetical protein